MSRPPQLKSLKMETVVRHWGSAGAMSRPPQLKSLKMETVVRHWGSAGAMSGPPQLKSLEEVNGCPQNGCPP